MDLTYKLGEFVENTKYTDIPDETIRVQKESILDNIGNILGASGIGEGCKEAVDVAEQMACGGSREATVIGFGKKLPVVWAAFANASMAHSLDFGDSFSACGGSGHPNSSTFPAALALAEKLNVSGKDFLTALVLGSEIACRLSIANRHRMDVDGFYPPMIITSYGATTAAAKLLGLDPRQYCDALSFNLCQSTCSSEITNNKDTVIRSIREAFAAKSAVLSAFMAKRGMKGFDQPLEGKRGFFHTYSRGECVPEKMLDGLGTDFHAGKIMFKPWPSCLGTHTAIDASIELAVRYDIRPEEIEEVHLRVSRENTMLVEPAEIKKAPESGIVAKFSDYYASAVAFSHRSCTLRDYSEQMIHDQKLRNLMKKYTCDIVDDWNRENRRILWTEVIVKTARGTFSQLTKVPYGAEGRPMSYEEICKKMAGNISMARDRVYVERTDRIREVVEHLEDLSSIRELTALL